MRLGINLGYWGAGNDADNLALAREADRLGYLEELRGQRVRDLESAGLGEPQHALVEPLRPTEIRHREPHVVPGRHVWVPRCGVMTRSP